MITEAQERQMTTITANNVHPVGVKNCPDGGDDLDIVVANLFADKAFKDKLNLSSVNSINWGRILMQTVHYFYGYLQVVNRVGEEVNMAVPSGAFGNLCAGNIARKMGLPVATFVCSNNENACLHRIFSEGLFAKRPIIETISSAIDILIPYNFWRYLYFVTGEDPKKIKDWIAIFKEKGELQFDEESRQQLQAGIQSKSISDAQTLATIRTIYEKEVYLLDPHAAVAVAAAEALKSELGNKKMICLATAHPAKFPDTIQRALGGILPQSGQHTSIEIAKKRCEKLRICDHSHFEEALVHAMEQHWDSITKK
jgi:threonine synthase